MSDQSPSGTALFTTYDTDDGLALDGLGYDKSILSDSKGNLWFGTRGGGVSKYDGKSFTTFTTAQGLANNRVLSIAEDKNGNLWFGTSGGVSKYDGKSFTTFTTAQGLANNIVLSIAEDKNGNLWFGTYGGGVSKYDGNCEAITNTDKNKQEVSKSFTTFTTAQGLANNSVWSIAEDKNGNLWFGTYGGGVSKYDGKSFTTFTTAQGLANNSVLSIAEDKNGNLWFGTAEGLSVMRKRLDGEIASSATLPRNDGGTDEPLFINYTKNDGLPDNFIAAVREDRQGNIVLGTNFGLFVISTEEAARITAPVSSHQRVVGQAFNQFTGYPVRDVNTGQDNGTMLVDSKGIIWVGHGSNGVTRVELNEIIKHTRPPLVVVEKVKINEENICWYNLSQRSRGRDGEIPRSARNDNSPDSDSNGVPVIPNGAQRSEESPQNTGIANDSATVAQQEVMEFGRVLTQAERDTIRKQFADIRFDGITKWYPLPENLVLPYANNHVTFEYNAIVTDRHFLVNYQYKLQGQDEKWSPVTQKTDVSYGNLYEGDYTFLVKAQYTGPCEGAGCEWTEPLRYSFTVLPPCTAHGGCTQCMACLPSGLWRLLCGLTAGG